MAIDLIIKQRGLFKKPLSEADLSPAGLRTGHWNQAGVLDPGPASDGRVVCDPAAPGRGCFLRAVPGEKEQVCLRQPLPCTPRDLEVFYGLVQRICQLWNTDRFTQDGAERHLGDIPGMIQSQNREGAGLLRAMAERWQADGEGVLTGAVYPIYMEPETIERLKDGDLDFFQKCLAEKQAGDWYYAKPNFYRHDNGVDILGMYSITEGVPSILPIEPFVPPLYSVLLPNFHVTDEQVTEWRAGLTRVWGENGEMKGDTLGYLSFDEFARKVRLDQRPRFDAKHVIVEVKDLSEVLP